ncbi:MAG: hypothetical protein IKL83_04495 [Muribaculaceae bacterium]|nr:hypothetical protein [Muribaculaceae bacterium]
MSTLPHPEHPTASAYGVSVSAPSHRPKDESRQRNKPLARRGLTESITGG